MRLVHTYHLHTPLYPKLVSQSKFFLQKCSYYMYHSGMLCFCKILYHSLAFFSFLCAIWSNYGYDTTPFQIVLDIILICKSNIPYSTLHIEPFYARPLFPHLKEEELILVYYLCMYNLFLTPSLKPKITTFFILSYLSFLLFFLSPNTTPPPPAPPIAPSARICQN